MNTRRYQVVLPWRLGFSNVISVEVADLLDKQTGRTYIDGAQRVVDAKGKVVKTFAGETAWMDAERLASDLAFAERYAR